MSDFGLDPQTPRFSGPLLAGGFWAELGGKVAGKFSAKSGKFSAKSGKAFAKTFKILQGKQRSGKALGPSPTASF